MADSLVDELLEISDRISRGEVPEYQHQECYSSGVFDLLLVNARGAEAFAILEELCKRYREIEMSGKDRKGYFLLLSLLATQTQTTEMPVGMREIIAENLALSDELTQWYRISSTDVLD